MSLDEYANQFQARSVEQGGPNQLNSAEDFKEGRSNTVEFIQEELGMMRPLSIEEINHVFESYEFRATTTPEQVLLEYNALRDRKEAAVRFLSGSDMSLETGKAAAEELKVLQERVLNYMGQAEQDFVTMFAIGIIEDKSVTDGWVERHQEKQ